MFALPVALVLLLASAAAAAASRVVWLLAGRTYRFSMRIEFPPGIEIDADALIHAIEVGGGRDVLITKGAPTVALYTQTILVDHPVELGKPYVYGFESARIVLTVLEVEELPNA